jgi:RNA polymerase sigma-70 factor, ECF subfamily
MMGIVTANSPRNGGKPEAEPMTLGDLLYTGRKPHASEKEWIELVHAIGAGDQRALQSLYERANRPVFTLIMRIVHSRETAEELTLDVFHDIWRRASTYDAAGGSVLGWIMNQARCRAIDRVRFEQRKKRVNPDPGALQTPESRCDELQLEGREGFLRHALTTLTPHERQAIETAFFSELTYAEAAQRLQQPVGTIKTRIRSGLAKLRKSLGGGVGQA